MDKVLKVLIMQANASGFDLSVLLRLVEREYVQEALRRSKGNQKRAAGLIGVHRNSLHRKMAILDIPRRSYGN